MMGSGAVYPRVCGGTNGIAIMVGPRGGLSPRVRGNHWVLSDNHSGYGSIPACAGEPPTPGPAPAASRVYPRVCGGTTMPGRTVCALPGLSPRVRGNPPHRRRRQRRRRSIPACAGEPGLGMHRAICREVYPRVCGGTQDAVQDAASYEGLSPRVRGNLLLAQNRRLKLRSIPACAGEPPWTLPLTRRTKVYPRVCGGTVTGLVNGTEYEGLSPRVRGNRNLFNDLPGRGRSIPACAGEPPWTLPLTRRTKVYPRVCGGTPASKPIAGLGGGLSPRVRGNPMSSPIASACSRSIPACAGEPS